MAQSVKDDASRPDKQSSVPGMLVAEGRKQFTEVVLTSAIAQQHKHCGFMMEEG